MTLPKRSVRMREFDPPFGLVHSAELFGAVTSAIDDGPTIARTPDPVLLGQQPTRSSKSVPHHPPTSPSISRRSRGTGRRSQLQSGAAPPGGPGSPPRLGEGAGRRRSGASGHGYPGHPPRRPPPVDGSPGRDPARGGTRRGDRAAPSLVDTGPQWRPLRSPVHTNATLHYCGFRSTRRPVAVRVISSVGWEKPQLNGCVSSTDRSEPAADEHDEARFVFGFDCHPL